MEINGARLKKEAATGHTKKASVRVERGFFLNGAGEAESKHESSARSGSF